MCALILGELCEAREVLSKSILFFLRSIADEDAQVGGRISGGKTEVKNSGVTFGHKPTFWDFHVSLHTQSSRCFMEYSTCNSSPVTLDAGVPWDSGSWAN